MLELILALIVVTGMVGLVALPLLSQETLTLILAPSIPVAIVLILVLYPKLKNFSYRRWRITPAMITAHKIRDSLDVTPEGLSKSIVERAAAIRRGVPDKPSEVEVEMYALGYRTCVNDMITLTHIANEDLKEANFIRRIRLRRCLRKATEALATTRKALPKNALKTTRQEQQ